MKSLSRDGQLPWDVGPSRAYLRFYAELNDHLPAGEQYRTLEKPFFVPGSVKDMIESFGIPHTEVELIIANGESVSFSYVVQNGDRIAVYPVFETFDVTPELKVRRDPLRDLRFVLDVHLGRLTAYLRMVGFDTLYRNCFTDEQLVRVSANEDRILLTRDLGVLKHSAVTRGYLLRETDSRRQLAEIVRRFDLAGDMRPFTRCMACNGVLETVSKQAVAPLLPPRTAALYNEFRQCPQCGKIYWEGSHYRRMQEWLRTALAATP